MKKSLLLTGLLLAGLTAKAQNGTGTFFALDDNGDEVTYEVSASFENGKLTVENFNDTKRSLGFNVNITTGEVTSDPNVIAFIQDLTYEDGDAYMTNTFRYCDIDTKDYTIYGKFVNISDNQCALILKPWAIYTNDLLYPKHAAYYNSTRYDNTVTFNFVVEGLPNGSIDKGPEEEQPKDVIEGLWSFEFRSYDADAYFGKNTVERYRAKYNEEEKTVTFSWEMYTDDNGTYHTIRFGDIKADYDPATGKIYISEAPVAVMYGTRTVYQMPVLYTPDWDEPVRTFIDTKFDKKTGTIPVEQYQSIVWINDGNPASQVLMGPMVLRNISKDGFEPSDDNEPDDPAEPDDNGVGEISTDESAARYYNLQGVEIAHPEKGSICIKVEGNNTQKIIVK